MGESGSRLGAPSASRFPLCLRLVSSGEYGSSGRNGAGVLVPELLFSPGPDSPLDSGESFPGVGSFDSDCCAIGRVFLFAPAHAPAAAAAAAAAMVPAQRIAVARQLDTLMHIRPSTTSAPPARTALPPGSVYRHGLSPSRAPTTQEIACNEAA